jgi:hypothetical protein
MLRRVIGLVAALLVFLGIVAVTDINNRATEGVASEDLARRLPEPTTAPPKVYLAQIASWDDSDLVMPASVPDGWSLTFAGILPASETKEGCDQVELDYEDPNDKDRGFLYLYEFPNKYAKPLPNGSPFTAGAYSGATRYSDEEGLVAQITVGETTVQATTDLSVAELRFVLEALAPLDLSGATGVRP